MHGVSPSSTWTTLLGGFLVAGIGIGITNPSIGQAAIAVVPVEKAGMGSGINTTFRQVGIATGVAGLGAVFQSSVNSKLSELLPHAPDGLGELVASGGSRAAAAATPARIRPEVVHASDIAFVSAFNEILLIAAILSFAGATLGFLLVRSRDFVQPPAPEAEPARRDRATRIARLPAAGGPPRCYTGRVLRELRIENLLLIEKAELRLGEGLNAITGETGAGKTVLAHSLDLLMGGKARPQIVRPGAEEAWVEGVFDLPAGLLDEPEMAEVAERLPDGARRGRARAAGLGRRADQRLRRRARRHGRRPEAARRAGCSPSTASTSIAS